MTPDLITLVLSLPLPVRLSLFDADPTGPGWYVNNHEEAVFPCQAKCGVERLRHYINEFGDAWSPCNPLAIVEHAARLRFGKAVWCASMLSIAERGEFYALIELHDGDMTHKASGKCPHTAAIALLREVVGS